MSMPWKKIVFAAALLAVVSSPARASERVFTYTYEPETMPQGGFEFEQWTTLRAGRDKAVGQDDFVRWDFRQELEFGVTDDYTAALELDEHVETFEAPGGIDTRRQEFSGIGLENKFLVWNPVDHAVGLALYVEPHFWHREFELEEKIILGQRVGKDWKWAFNATHETEWEEGGEEGEGTETEGALEFTFGVTRDLGSHWSLGLEFRNHNEMPEYEEWAHTAFFLGPVLNYRSESWWVTVTALGQVYGHNSADPDPDGRSNFVLDEHELANIRCIVGLSF